MAWWNPEDLAKKLVEYTTGGAVRKKREYVEHWKEQISEHRTEFQLAGAGIAGFAVGGPVGMSTASAAMAKVQETNLIEDNRKALEAAKKSLAQNPYQTESEMRAASGIGATGELAFTRGISQWLPVALIFLVVMYFLFKR